MAKGIFSHFKLRPVMVADNVTELCLLHITLHIRQVVKALVALGVGRGISGGQHGVYLHSHKGGVYHGVFGIPRMDR